MSILTMLAVATTFLGFGLIYAASPRRTPALSWLASAARWGGAFTLILAAAVWCRDLGMMAGLIAWLAACSACGTLIILAAPLAPRVVAALALLAVLAVIFGGYHAWAF